MLSAVLGMDNLNVEDIMIPLSEIEGININDELEKIKRRIKIHLIQLYPFLIRTLLIVLVYFI